VSNCQGKDRSEAQLVKLEPMDYIGGIGVPAGNNKLAYWWLQVLQLSFQAVFIIIRISLISAFVCGRLRLT